MNGRKGNFFVFLRSFRSRQTAFIFCSLLGWQSLHLEDKSQHSRAERDLVSAFGEETEGSKSLGEGKGRAWDSETEELGVIGHVPISRSLPSKLQFTLLYNKD